jgi:ubiquinone/menaquinone biosynthesis C-methylase UbiE
MESYEILMDHLKPEVGKHIVDVSCGSGELLHCLERRGINHACGIDIVLAALIRAKKIVCCSHLVLANAEELPFKNEAFDYITCLGSLEHYPNPERALLEFKRVLKKDGKALITVPNPYYLFDIIEVYRKGYTTRGPAQIIDRHTTIGEWSDLLKSNGFKIETLKQYKEPLDTSLRGIFADLNPKKILVRIIKIMIYYIMPLNLSYQFIFICEKEM